HGPGPHRPGRGAGRCEVEAGAQARQARPPAAPGAPGRAAPPPHRRRRGLRAPGGGEVRTPGPPAPPVVPLRAAAQAQVDPPLHQGPRGRALGGGRDRHDGARPAGGLSPAGQGRPPPRRGGGLLGYGADFLRKKFRTSFHHRILASSSAGSSAWARAGAAFAQTTMQTTIPTAITWPISIAAMDEAVLSITVSSDACSTVPLSCCDIRLWVDAERLVLLPSIEVLLNQVAAATAIELRLQPLRQQGLHKKATPIQAPPSRVLDDFESPGAASGVIHKQPHSPEDTTVLMGYSNPFGHDSRIAAKVSTRVRDFP